MGHFINQNYLFLEVLLENLKIGIIKETHLILDKNGYGTAVYSFSKNERIYSLVCFAQHINPEERSDRVIATKWDAAFVLHDGDSQLKKI